MDKTPVRILLVEDDEEDYLLTRKLFAEFAGARYALDWASTYEAAAEVMARREHDVYLVDHRLGARDGLELLREPDRGGALVIMLTGRDDRELDLRAMNAGAMDYLVKGQITAEMLERSIRYGLERRRLEEALQLRADQLAEADRRKDEFLGMLAHELRNPLAPIVNAVRILGLRGEGDPISERMRGMVEEQVKHMARLLDDLLDVSRITRGTIRLRREPLELAPIVHRAVEANRHLVEARGHDLAVALPAGPVWLEADPTRLVQILANLLTNAVKYTDPGGRIVLTAEVGGGEVVLQVQDTGIGIAPEMLPRIFELFVQVDRSLDRSQEGLGIGLTLVKNLVELHGGSIAAHSRGLGQGSEFIVRLPLLSRTPTREGPASGREEAKGPRRPRRILVVDDNEPAAESLALVLQFWGHDVQVVHDGPTALEVVSERPPEVILLDLGLPGMDGYHVARELRKHPDSGGVLLAAMTGYAGEEHRRRCREAGFDHHLVKPLDLDALEELLGLTSSCTGLSCQEDPCKRPAPAGEIALALWSRG
jgi:signal transduction histidine kinase